MSQDVMQQPAGDDIVDPSIETDHLESETVDQPVEVAAAEPVRTGHEQVDRVLGTLDGLDEADIDTHVAVFERAHEELRQALDAQGSGGIPAALRPPA